MLARLIAGRWLTANGVIALLPANTVNDDDIEIYTDESRSEVALTWRNIRQQSERPIIDGVMRPNRCLADFVAPKDTGIADYIGLFAVTGGIGVDKREAAFEADHDDYSAIMLKALADRFAEGFAECLHARVRRDLWGYAAAETLDNDALIREEYRGIRPAPGYPACPEHTVKRDMFRVLDAQEIGMHLTEALAMTPAASVSGFYLSHPDSTYFTLGKIGQDQVDDMAARSGEERRNVERALAPNL
jgi:5-methyltetrahydrofolate--homocysteine methyltransferase